MQIYIEMENGIDTIHSDVLSNSFQMAHHAESMYRFTMHVNQWHCLVDPVTLLQAVHFHQEPIMICVFCDIHEYIIAKFIAVLIGKYMGRWKTTVVYKRPLLI